LRKVQVPCSSIGMLGMLVDLQLKYLMHCHSVYSQPKSKPIIIERIIPCYNISFHKIFNITVMIVITGYSNVKYSWIQCHVQQACHRHMDIFLQWVLRGIAIPTRLLAASSRYQFPPLTSRRSRHRSISGAQVNFNSKLESWAS